ncbi:MAG: hypothetical protein AB7G35_23625 [Hyphomicrobiaceae bacterium]
MFRPGHRYTNVAALMGGVPFLPLSVPTGFGWTDGPVVGRRGGGYATTFDIDAHRPVTSVTYYVDPIAGNNANNGLSEAAPKEDLSNAITAANTGGVAARFLLKPGIYRASRGWNGAALDVTHIIEPWAADPTAASSRIIIDKGQSANWTWTQHDGATYVRGTTSGSDPTHVLDFAISANGFPAVRYPKAADLATCIATAGTWWRDGSNNIYVHALDGRSLVGDASVRFSETGNNAVVRASASLTSWMQNICFAFGGVTLQYVFTTNAGQTINCYAKDCFAIGSGGNGVQVSSNLSGSSVYAYFTRFGAGFNQLDGFNYDGAGGGGARSRYFENECFTERNGYSGGNANNATTSHDATQGICIKGLYRGSEDRVVADISSAQRWMLGCDIRASAGTGTNSETVVAGSANGQSASIWLDGCALEESDDGCLNAFTGSAIRYANMNIAGLSTEGGGTIAAYTP